MRVLITVFLVVLHIHVLGQNLIPNGSFEEYEMCPITNSTINAVGWSNSLGTCDYFHSCNNEIFECGVGVPCNTFGYQHAFDGDAYVGFIQFRTPNPSYREQLTCSLNDEIIAGETYYFSMKINRGASVFITKASSGQGFLLTNEIHDADNNPSSPFGGYTFVNPLVVSDSTNWQTISTSFVADNNYSEFVLGAFLESSELDTLSAGDVLPYGEAYYFIDDVRLSLDSNFVYSTVNQHQDLPSLVIYPNPGHGQVRFNQSLHSGRVIVRNVLGELVMTQVINEPLEAIDFMRLPRGNYVISIYDKSNTAHFKYLKL